MPVIFGIIVSALNSFFGAFITKALITFVLFTALYVLVSLFMSVVLGLLPTGDGGVSSAFAGIPSGVWYFIDLFRVDLGVPAVCGAFLSRFIIRRLPIIG